MGRGRDTRGSWDKRLAWYPLVLPGAPLPCPENTDLAELYRLLSRPQRPPATGSQSGNEDKRVVRQRYGDADERDRRRGAGPAGRRGTRAGGTGLGPAGRRPGPGRRGGDRAPAP